MRTLTENENRNVAVAAIAGWWQRWRRKMSERQELEDLGPDEIARYAQDTGLTSADLRALADHGRADTSLLYRRMNCLHVDREELAHTDRATLRDMERLCSLCRARGRCARDLADEDADPAWQNWRDYCPNSTTLTILSTMQDCRRVPKE